jgi:GrpB-like predicted nucleotidyltransferase (UPF0157 family)
MSLNVANERLQHPAAGRHQVALCHQGSYLWYVSVAFRKLLDRTPGDSHDPKGHQAEHATQKQEKGQESEARKESNQDPKP